MARRGALVVAAAALLLAVPARAQFDSFEEDAFVASRGADEARAAEAEVRTAMDLYRRAAEVEPAGNLLLSPWCVSAGVMLTSNGAAGETRRAMRAAIHLSDLSDDDLIRAQDALRASILEADPEITVEVASSLWLARRLNFSPAFLTMSREVQGATVNPLDFGSAGAPDTLNAWVRRATHERISSLVDHLPPETALALMTAIYFKGNWTVPFKEEETRDGLFAAPGGARTVRMMNRRGRFLYMEEGGLRAVSLPYGNERFAMLLILPASSEGLKDLGERLDAAFWEDRLGRLAWREGHVALPRFRMESAVDLVPVLTAMGMGAAFDPAAADFSGMVTGSERIYLKEARHKAVVEVNEQGTEAAGAVSLVASVTSVESIPPFEFVADRPFLCAIRDVKTGTILFLGVVRDPAPAG